ncbi:MAG TPA: polyphosphate kinase 1 [Prolixibacteraceae bacterium]|nr:polyphosphate kinase 1 [Prolixibacteraceae bacterium]
MSAEDQYINREISWLSFNERVLQEAEDPRTPLLERIRFIGIFSNNLDEFFRVRVATVRRMVDFGKDEEGLLGQFSPRELHEKIQEIVSRQQFKVQEIFSDIIRELNKNNIFILNEKQLNHNQGMFVRKYFQRKVLPNLVPVMLSKKNPFPYLRDRAIYLAVKLSGGTTPGDIAYSLIRIPGESVPRFLVLPASGSKKFVIMLDDVIRYCFDDLFFYFNYRKFEAYTLKITRDAEIDLDDDISKSFIEKMEAGLKKRKTGRAVRLIYDREMPSDLLRFIMKKMKIEEQENAVPGGRYHNYKDFMDFPEIGKPGHYYPKLPPFRHKDLPLHTSMLKVLRKKDVILHFPYHTFTHVIDLLREAAIDPQVQEIGITLYRVASDSKVVNALLNAVRNGKKVTVVIELQARFDEEANIYWSNLLQEEGANVINGIPGLKIHSKLLWVKRMEGGKLQHYAFVGTGNFNESTARIYADEGLLTAHPDIAEEVANIFEFFKHNYKHFEFRNLLVSPFNMKSQFIKMINKEIKYARKGKLAWMILKMNSLIDPEMMVKIYEASQAGVQVKLIVRGIFGMKTGIEGLSENIEGISIVDKYLEHSRIFVFHNDGDERVFISSADWMPRNLNRRLEVAVPIFDREIQKELKEMLLLQLDDNTKARILDPELKNLYDRSRPQKLFRAQEDYYNLIKKQHHIVMKIYHNPRCAHSRAGLNYLEKKGYDLEVKKYLTEGLDAEERSSRFSRAFTREKTFPPKNGLTS